MIQRLNGTIFGFQPDLKYYHGYVFLSPGSLQDLKGKPAEPRPFPPSFMLDSNKNMLYKMYISYKGGDIL